MVQENSVYKIIPLLKELQTMRLQRTSFFFVVEKIGCIGIVQHRVCVFVCEWTDRQTEM